MAYLEINSVSKSFVRAARKRSSEYQSLPVLRNIELAIRENEFVCIVGRSGSGKTTLISLIAGLLAPDSGEILLEGKPIGGPGPDRGVVFQNYSLLPWMTVFENVYLAVDAVAVDLPQPEKRLRAQYYIDLVNLGAALKKLPRELSGGMRQRVCVARGLAMEPKVLLMDEPFSALDALTRGSLQEELARIWLETRKTVVMITNDIDEAVLLADTIYTLTAGKGATLSRAISVTAAHPRSRMQLSAAVASQRARRQTLQLLAGRPQEQASEGTLLVGAEGQNERVFGT
jgi:nitrate/nitrite transport system ATP-binding protein